MWPYLVLIGAVFLTAGNSLRADDVRPFKVALPSSYAPLPEAITSFGAIESEGWLYVYGGHLGNRHEYSSNEVSGACRRLNLADGITWETLPADVPAQSPALVAYRNSVYRIGGMAARNPKGEKQNLLSYDSVGRLDLSGRRWVPLASLPEARSSHDAVVIGDKLFVAGGWKLSDAPRQWHDTVLSLDLTKSEARWESAPQPFKRRGLCLAALGSKLFCIGGMDEDDSPSLAVDILETATGAWTKGPELPSGKLKGFGASACVVNGRLYVSGMSGTVWRLNEKEESWDEFARLRTARFFHRLIAVGTERLLAIGGESAEGKLRDIEVIPLVSVQAMAWPQFRGAARDGISSEVFVATNWPREGPPVLWRAQVGKGLSSFAVSNGRLFTLGNANETDTLWALNAESGKPIWRFDYPCPSTNHPMSIVPGGPAATPTIAEGKVYSLSREGDFFCVSESSGELLWKTHLVEDLRGQRPVYGYANSALVEGGLVFLDVGGTTGSTVALDASTGTVRWRTGVGAAGYSSPRLTFTGGQPALSVFKGEAFALFNPRSGDLLAAHPITTRDFCNTITPVVAGDAAFISNTGSNGTMRLNLDGKELRMAWCKPELGLLFNSPVLWQGRLYAFNDSKRNENELVCLDAATGETKWTFKDIEKGVFTIADGKMVLVTRTSELVVLSLTEGGPTILARAQLIGGKSWVEPVVVGGRIYCRNNDGAMVVASLIHDS